MLYGAPTARRQDAQRNRAAILQAATEIVTGGGSGLPMPEIARRAGVGQATLYRHFPDRSALVEAVIDDQLRLLETVAAAGAGQPAVFRHLLREVLHAQIAMRPLVVLARRLDPGSRHRYRRRMLAAFAEPLRSARAGGDVRGDLVPDDLMLLFTMVQSVAEATDDLALARAAADRAVDLVLDGVFRVPSNPVT